MRVYHGSLEVVDNPDLNRLNYRTDFGKGFYTTTDLEQAKRWTKIKERRLLEDNPNVVVNKYINVFEYEENSNLNILVFDEPSEEWLKFIFANRLSESLLHNYDIVKGPVANDNLYQVLLGYESNWFDFETAIKRLKTYLLANQISFHTEKSLECLKYIETIRIGD